MSVIPKTASIAARLFLLSAGAACLTLFATGCASSDSSSESEGAAAGASGRDRYQVKVERAPFYSQGPAQGSGPDISLVEGTVVRMLERSFGYSKVISSYGEGWMATGDLEPAPPEEPEPYVFNNPGSDSTSDPTPLGTTPAVPSNEPVYAQPEDLILPEPDPEPLPEPTGPQPTFRY